MVEVLVALVVMSVGMLGIAALYVTTLQAKTTSLSRMQAVNLAHDMADRIRANPNTTAASNYTFTESSTATATPGVLCVNNTTTAPSANCTADQLATYELFQWSNLALNTLPGTVKRSIATTEATPTTPAIYLITLKWTEPNTSGELTYALQVQI